MWSERKYLMIFKFVLACSSFQRGLLKNNLKRNLEKNVDKKGSHYKIRKLFSPRNAA